MHCLAILVCLSGLTFTGDAAPLGVQQLRCEYLVNPLAIDCPRPRLSWVLQSTVRGQRQTAYRVLVASAEEKLARDEGDLWDSGRVASDATVQVEYAGQPLASCTPCYWKVQVWDKDGQPSAFSEPARWTMGLLHPGDWKAQWIAWPEAIHNPSQTPLPATMFRKEFSLKSPIRRAIVHVTARGLYELRINGHRVGSHILAPEWTEYDRRVQYQTYDVTQLLQAGDNAIGAEIGDGWFAGRIGGMGRYNYGDFLQFLAQLEIETADGQRQTIGTDASWQATQDGPIRFADIFDGEVYDAQREMPGWDAPGFAARGWKPPQAAALDAVPLVAQPNEPIRVIEELKPVKLTEPKPGVFLFDFGQNMVGWGRVTVHGEPGAKIQFRHGEMLNDDGTLYTVNLRGASQVDFYTLREATGVYEPHFTYHGFRYLEVTGTSGQRPTLEDAVGRVFSSTTPEASRFDSSNELMNQLVRNVRWTQRANLMSSPTDCPQRDERLGWLGDAQIFSQTAIFNSDMAAFYSKWTADLRDVQLADGRYPTIAPRANRKYPDPSVGTSTPGYSDAGAIIPWRIYVNYADRRILEENYAAAKRWIDYVVQKNPNGLWLNDRGSDYGDWLNGDTLILDGYPKGISAVPKEVLATAYFAHTAELMAKMAAVLGHQHDARQYQERFEAIRKAFQEAYVDAEGKVHGDTQGGYALALDFNLLPDALRPKAVAHLLAAIQRYKGHLSTGIQSTNRMMLGLSRNGQHAEACRLLNQRTIPSWGFMIDQGATTVWERWDGYVPGRGFQDPIMNSFNHWALGSVEEWLWREVVGLNPDETQPGYEHFTLRPRVGQSFTWVDGQYDSIRGRIKCHWKLDGGRLVLEVTVPPNTTATVHVPTADATAVREGDVPAAQASGVRAAGVQDDAAVFEVVSGTYHFSAPCP